MGTHGIDIKSSPGLLSGTMLVIATVVGGGMFSLPIALSGVWFAGGGIILIVISLLMLLTGLMLVEVNSYFEPGASFNTFTLSLLGQRWNIAVGITFGFVLYILTYAYISGSSAVISQTALQYAAIPLPHRIAVIIVSVTIGGITWYSSRLVGRITTVLILAKFIAFFATFSRLVSYIELEKLFNLQSVALKNTQYWPYILMTFPFCIISFGFHGNVPSLVKLYGRTGIVNITRSIIIGSLFALFLYLFWIAVTMGNISRAAFPAIIAKGGNIDVFVEAIDGVVSSSSMDLILTFFGNFAVASSLLAATLGLFDYIADLFCFHDDSLGRLKTALITYLPPAVICYLFPNGFVYAMGYAGLAFTLWSIILPPLLVKRARQCYPEAIYRAPCNRLMLNGVIFCGGVIYLSVVLDILGWLPTFS